MYQFFVDVPLKKGTVLHGRYQVSRVLGTGSYGMVYLCRDLQTNEPEVVKQLRPSKCRSQKEIQLFDNEISILRTVNHKNLPELHEAFSHGGCLFYAMSFIDAANLEDFIFLNKKQFNERESLFFLARLLDVVAYLHQKNIYHQDIRIPNILVKNSELFLIDFGLSKSVTLADPFSTSQNPLQNKEGEALKLRQQDYYDLGETLLYLLYTTYSSNNKKALPWTEELSLKKETVYLLKKLLGIHKPYSSDAEISADLQASLKAAEKNG